MSNIKVNRFENTSGVAYGAVLQVVNFQTGAMSTTTATIPRDDTIPQNTEGAEILSASITPKSSSNKLKITVIVQCSNSGNSTVTVALFKDSDANAIATGYGYCNSLPNCIIFTHYMTASTASQIDFSVRAAGNGATTTFNGHSGTRTYGGTMASSITIEEIQV
jgi:hypothetical protein